jgi:hypothetical protein
VLQEGLSTRKIEVQVSFLLGQIFIENTFAIKLPSFFSIFTNLKRVEINHAYYDDIVEDLQSQEEIAVEIANELIPRAVYYYLGLIDTKYHKVESEAEEEDETTKKEESKESSDIKN